MRLSYQIPFLTGVTLILTVFVNIFAFQYFIGSLLPQYIAESSLSVDIPSPNPGYLDALVKIGQLDNETQDDYKKIINELSNLSTSLKNIAENPKLYISTGSSNSDISAGAFTIAVTSGSTIFKTKNILDVLANPASFDRNSPEWLFILKLLWNILITNIIWLLIILSVYYFWIRKIFSPVNIIIDRLRKFIDTSEYSGINYMRDDEFFPLISTINNLHRSLSIQENIRSNFLSDLSHEIRTPITAVRLYLEAIEDGVLKIDAHTASLLQSELARLTHITEKMMEYEHLAKELIGDIHVERFQAKKVIAEILETYRPQLHKTHQEVIIDFPNDTMTRMDKGMFAQVIHNVFSNFIKYAWRNTNLLCKYLKTPDVYVFTFSDDGIGIPENELHLVKEKFYRVDKWRARDEYISMGIGLSIVERIARLHNGNLEIQKNTPTGVVLTITIKR